MFGRGALDRFPRQARSGLQIEATALYGASAPSLGDSGAQDVSVGQPLGRQEQEGKRHQAIFGGFRREFQIAWAVRDRFRSARQKPLASYAAALHAHADPSMRATPAEPDRAAAPRTPLNPTFRSSYPSRARE